MLTINMLLFKLVAIALLVIHMEDMARDQPVNAIPNVGEMAQELVELAGEMKSTKLSSQMPQNNTNQSLENQEWDAMWTLATETFLK